MKPLKESLFDVDKVTQDIPLTPNIIWDNLIYGVYRDSERICKKNGWNIDLNDDRLKVFKTFISNPRNCDTDVELNIFKSTEGYPLIPLIRFCRHDKYDNTTISDNYAVVKRCWDKDIEVKKGIFYEWKFACLDKHDAIKSMDFIKKMIEKITSREFTKIIQNIINQYEEKDIPVPGIIIDHSIMKKLIKEI